MALATGWLWIIVYPSIIVALPAVAYWTIAKWRAPENYLIPRRRWRFFAAWVGIFSIPLLIVALFLIPARLR
jgi:phosphoglycerol transferase MdoB-like AlkP superfamily enzyme